MPVRGDRGIAKNGTNLRINYLNSINKIIFMNAGTIRRSTILERRRTVSR